MTGRVCVASWDDSQTIIFRREDGYVRTLNCRVKYTTVAFILAGAIFITLPALVAAIPTESTEPRAGEQINWQVISGGGTRATSATMVLNGTIGQTAIGTGASASYGLIAGYWQDFGGGGCCVIPGDANHDGSRDISDLTYFVDFMFGGGPAPICQEEFDNDGNCSQDISDLTYYVDFMFGGGPDPVACHECP